jgi:hypothetical protein
MSIDVLWRLILLAMFPLGSLVLAWRQSLQHDGRFLSRFRRSLSVLGLGLTSVGLLIFLAFSVQTARIQGWFNDQDAMLIWIRAGGWISLAGIILTIFGRGKSRIWGTVSGILVAGVWFLVASAQP